MPLGNPIARFIESVRARMSTLPGLDGKEAGAYDEAVRVAYRTDTTIDAPRPIAPPESPPFDPRLQRPIRSSSMTKPGTTIRPVESAAPPAVPEVKARGRRPQIGETAPESLRTPASVTSVADDFFDGLIRRVEGDR